MKKWLKRLGILILTPIVLIILLVVLLYVPPIQNWVAHKAAAYASEQTGMDITVGHVSLKFPLDLSLEELRVIKDNELRPGERDTIADVGQLVVDVRLWPLFKGQVEVDALEFNQLKVNTDGLIASTRVKGELGHLFVESHGIDLNEGTVVLNTARLNDARFNVELSDTVPSDTTQSETFWKIRVDDLQLANADVTVHLPGDTLQVQAYMGRAQAKDALLDLYRDEYQVRSFDLNDGRLWYDNNYAPAVHGLDTNHLALTDINIGVDSVYFCSPKINLSLRECAFKEKSGISVDKLTGPISIDSTKVSLPAVELTTPDSHLKASLQIDLNAFDSHHPGAVYAQVDGSFGKQDLMRFMGDMPNDFVRKWPNHPLSVSGRLTGNMQHADFKGLNVSLPTAFNLNASGYIDNLSTPSLMKADVTLKGKTGNLDFVSAMLPADVNREIRIPHGIGIDGRVQANGSKYAVNLTASEGGGTLKTDARIDTRTMSYDAEVRSQAFPLQHFVPNYGLSAFTGYVKAKGQGTDIFSKGTTLDAEARIEKFKYDQWSLDGMNATARISKGLLNANIDSRNPLFNGKVDLTGDLGSKSVKATVSADFQKLDLYNLRLVDEPLSLTMYGTVDVNTDMKDFYDIQGNMANLSISYKNDVYTPENLDLDIYLNRDTTHAVIDSGDFHLNLDGHGGYNKILSQISHFSNELTDQFADRRIDEAALRKKMPDVDLYLSTGRNNFISELIRAYGYDFKSASVNVTSSHVTGLNGLVTVDSLVVDSIYLDQVDFNMLTDDEGFKYNARVENFKGHPQYSFMALAEGSLLERGSDLGLKLYDDKDSLAVDVGLRAQVVNDSLQVFLTNTRPVLGYKQFRANSDNYLALTKGNRLSARLDLIADDGMAVQVYTSDDNMEADQDLTVSLHRFDLGKIFGVLPYLPQVTGVMDGDYHVVKEDKTLTVSSQMAFQQLTYEGSNLGNISTELVYLPNEDGSHSVDALLFSDDREVGTLIGTYYPDGGGRLDANFKMARLPLSMANAFLPEHLLSLKGYAEGTLSVKGKLSSPQIDGEIYLDSSYVMSPSYGVQMRIANDPVRIVNSHLLFENFQLFAYNEESLDISGYFDFSNLSRMMLDLRMQARNLQLINAKETPMSEAYGKAFVNLFATLRGPVEGFTMRGKLDVLGTTDMTYVLKDSPLTTDTRMDELVKFVDFSDSTQQVISRPPVSGLNMDLSIGIDRGAHIKCDLNSEHTNYVDLIGGGDLRLRYNSVESLQLTGRYTLANGEMKYSLPVIPLRTFTIKDGSYIEFTGNPGNPRLNITATEHIKTTVSDDGGTGRSVDFEAGVIITKTLSDMGLRFIIDAPEDMTVSNQLNVMSEEDRGKTAVTMLTTGMYLADGNTSGFTMNNALSSFLQSEINNIAGNALRTLDLSFGIDNATDASGRMHTDYSFKFAKRFWNNRLRVIVGGKISTGSDVVNQNESFFNNVTFEYRLDDTANKYVKLFYIRDTNDWFEGAVGQFGAGFMWRRKLNRFMDIFNFKSDSPTLPPRMTRDSVSVITPVQQHENSDTLSVEK